MKILIADDDPNSLRLLESYLTKWGYEVAAAADGAEALELFEANEFPMVITDWMMPTVDGLELIRRIRSTQGCPYVYLILLTARSRKEDVVAGIEAGADDFLTKPFDRDELRARLRAAERILRLEHNLALRNEQLESVNAQISSVNSRMKRDLEAGARIQQALLPTFLPDMPGADFAWRLKPCDELAGDILNVFPLDDHHVALYVLDVSGHGVPAALLSVAVSRLLSRVTDASSLLTRRNGCAAERQILPPVEVAEELNRRFPWDPITRQYFTLIYGILDTRTGHFRFVSAGHPGPLHLPVDDEPRIVEAPAFPIGMMDDAQYEEQSILLKPGDRLYLYTDGIPEAMSPRNEAFGNTELMRVISECRDRPLDEGLSVLLGELESWAGRHSLRDDISILGFEYVGITADRTLPMAALR